LSGVIRWATVSKVEEGGNHPSERCDGAGAKVGVGGLHSWVKHVEAVAKVGDGGSRSMWPADCRLSCTHDSLGLSGTGEKVAT